MRLLLCTDLDRTLVPNGAAPESARARPLFRYLAARPEVTLVYVSGRDRGLIDEAVAAYDLPRPDVAISDVGTAIAEPTDTGWQVWRGWEQELGRSWRGRRAADLAGVLAAVTGLTPQAPERQGLFKLSFEFPAAADAAALRRAVVEVLEPLGVEATVVASSDEAAGVGLLDVLPAAAGKRPAIEHVMARLLFAPAETVFAGDSGNDLDVLAGPLPAVLVANAAPAVKEEARRLAAAAGHADTLHIARGGPLGLNGNYAAGILEGVLHHQPAWAAILEAGP